MRKKYVFRYDFISNVDPCLYKNIHTSYFIYEIHMNKV